MKKFFDADWEVLSTDEAELVNHTIDRVVKRYYPFIAAQGLVLLTIFRKEPNSSGAITEYSKAVRPPKTVRAFIDGDFILWFAKKLFVDGSDEIREAMVDHALAYIRYGPNGWTIDRPDLVEFSAVLGRRGAWNPELSQKQEAIRQLSIFAAKNVEVKALTYPDQEDDDNLYSLANQAVDLIAGRETVNISILQKLLRVGYTRAGAVMNELERIGAVTIDDGRFIVNVNQPEEESENDDAED
jgi:DNA segregation ATPase FtsK/SpoIIIE-like protein